MPAANWQRDRGSRFYRGAALAAALVALAGFFLTYFRPLVTGTFAGPPWAHVHGVLMFSWLALVVIQAFLLPQHRQLGWLALILAPAVAASTMAIGVAATRRDLASGIEVGMAGNITAPLIFCVLVAAAIMRRKDPQWHKRLIFMATVLVLWPAWFRWRHFLPAMERPDIWLGLVLAQLPLGLAMLRDRLQFGAVHPAYLFVGLPLIAEQAFEAFAFGQPFWNRFGMWLYAVLA